MALGDKQLIVQRASVGAKGGVPIDESTATMVNPINIPGLQIASGALSTSTVLCLMNMVSEDELVDDEEYEGIVYTKCITFMTIPYLYWSMC